MRIRERNDPMRTDKYFLVTTEEGAAATRCGWSSTPTQFMDQLKSLAPCSGSGDLGRSIMIGLNLLNEVRRACPRAAALRDGRPDSGRGRSAVSRTTGTRSGAGRGRGSRNLGSAL